MTISPYLRTKNVYMNGDRPLVAKLSHLNVLVSKEGVGRDVHRKREIE